MQKAVERLREEIEAFVTAAYQQDEAEEAALRRRGDELPAELTRREERVAKIEEAMRRLEAEAKAEADASANAGATPMPSGTTGKNVAQSPHPLRRLPRQSPAEFYDPAAIMRMPNKGWDYCAPQASVDGACQIILPVT